MKKAIYYILLVLVLCAIPLILPNDLAIPGFVVGSCLFVILCFYLKIRSLSALFLPIAILSTVVPIIVLILIGMPVYHSFPTSAMQVYNTMTAYDWFKMTIPVLLSLATYLILRRVSIQR